MKDVRDLARKVYAQGSLTTSERAIVFAHSARHFLGCYASGESIEGVVCTPEITLGLLAALVDQLFPFVEYDQLELQALPVKERLNAEYWNVLAHDGEEDV